MSKTAKDALGFSPEVRESRTTEPLTVSGGGFYVPIFFRVTKGLESLVSAGLQAWVSGIRVPDGARPAITDSLSALVDEWEAHMRKRESERTGPGTPPTFRLTKREQDLLRNFLLFTISRYMRQVREGRS